MLNFIKRIWASSVASQLILGIALVHAVLMTIFVFDLVEREREFLIKENRNIAIGLADTLAANGTSWVVSNDIVGMEEIIESQSQFPNIEYAMFINMQGKILAYTERELVGKYLSDAVSLRLLSLPQKNHIVYEDDHIVDVASPVIINHQQIGWARIGTSRQGITDNISYVTYKGLIYTLIAILVGILFAWVMAKSLTQGIRKLTESLQRVIDGDRQVTCYLDRHDELGELSLDFNRMLQTINEREGQLIKTHGALEKTEEKFKRLVENLTRNYIFYTHDKDGQFTYLSPSVKQVLGYELDEFMGRFDQYYVDNTKNETARLYTNRILNGETVSTFEIDVYDKQRDVHNFEITALPVFDSEHNVISVEGIAHDITEEKNFQRQLLEEMNKVDREQSLLSSLIDSMPDIVYYKNSNSQFIGCNRAFENYTGSLEEDVFGKVEDELPSNELLKELLDNEKESVEQRITVYKEVTLNSGSDSRLIFHTLTTPYLDSEHNVLGVIVICRDITEQKQKDELFNRSQKMEALGKLTGGIAHDYNNILGIIIGYAEMITLNIDKSDDKYRYAMEIKKAGERGASLTRKLLAFTRRESEVRKVKRTNLNKLLEQDMDMLQKTMTARIKVNMDLEENLADIYVDEADLQDAILNISINSMHAMPDGGELTFRTRHFDLGSDTDIPGLPEGRYCKLTIIDTGIGMDASVKNKIFDPFFSTKGDQGTGLGLSQVFGMIQRSKGAIFVDSEPGNGTEFNMYFRQYNESADSNNNKVLEGAVEVVNEGGAENALRVLLVDDEPALRTLGKEILEASGFRVFVAESASDAMQILEQETVDCLVSDIIMPEVDGFKLAQQVNEKYPQIKTLLVSGYNDQADNDELRRKYTILQKPYKARDLIKSINNL